MLRSHKKITKSVLSALPYHKDKLNGTFFSLHTLLNGVSMNGYVVRFHLVFVTSLSVLTLCVFLLSLGNPRQCTGAVYAGRIAQW